MSTCHDASHLSATEGDDEIYKQTAFQPRISRPKNALVPEAKRGANDRRPHRADRCLLGTGILLGRSLEPDRKSLSDARSPLRVPGVGRATGSLTASDSVSILNMPQLRMSGESRAHLTNDERGGGLPCPHFSAMAYRGEDPAIHPSWLVLPQGTTPMVGSTAAVERGSSDFSRFPEGAGKLSFTARIERAPS